MNAERQRRREVLNDICIVSPFIDINCLYYTSRYNCTSFPHILKSITLLFVMDSIDLSMLRVSGHVMIDTLGTVILLYSIDNSVLVQLHVRH